MSNPNRTDLDQQQLLQESFDSEASALRILDTSNLVPSEYDEIDLTYVPSGNGVGEIQTVTYKLAGDTIALLTLSYNSDNKLSSVVRS